MKVKQIVARAVLLAFCLLAVFGLVRACVFDHELLIGMGIACAIASPLVWALLNLEP